MSDSGPDIDQLPPLRDIISRYDLRAQKKLGQNFLLDLNITDKIARSAGDLENVTVFEIGPGPGGLTRSLLVAGAQKVIAVEFDQRAVSALQSLQKAAKGRLEIIHGDALKSDLLSLAPDSKRVIVANLPYNIATPLLIGWLKQVRNVPEAYERMILMFQREVADRIVAVPGNKIYGRLAVMTQWLCRCRKLFDLPPSAFTPPPKVTSSVVEFVPYKFDSDLPAFEAPFFEEVERITAAAFGQRRKMLRSSLKGWEEAMKKVGIDPTLRAEQLSVDDYIKMAKLAPLAG